jgi:hypothetical protein
MPGPGNRPRLYQGDIHEEAGEEAGTDEGDGARPHHSARCGWMDGQYMRCELHLYGELVQLQCIM